LPELPEVETVRRGLHRRLIGRTVRSVEVRRADLRWPLPKDLAPRLKGRRLVQVGRRGKYLLLEFAPGPALPNQVLLIHLGMTGRLIVRAKAGPGKRPLKGAAPERKTAPETAHEHVVFGFDDGQELAFADPRRFGSIDLVAMADLDRHPRLRDLGPDPFPNAPAPDRLLAALKGRTTSIKAALTDQKLMAGLGNIYVSEILHEAMISPRRPANKVSDADAEALSAAIRKVLGEGVAAGGASLRDYVQANGDLGNFQAQFKVYDREGHPCPRCGQPIKRVEQGGRATFYCARCQR
jgi:formamidopyrimidine-DNA glycosylase